MPGATRSGARAKERILSFRDDFGECDPKTQRPELWNIYNSYVSPASTCACARCSNWTELDVWRYVSEERIELPTIYMAHRRDVSRRDGMLYAMRPTSRCSPARSRSRSGCASAPSGT